MAPAATVRTLRALLPGVYTPTLTFFDPKTDELDIAAIKKHSLRLVEAGIVGLVTLGSNGECVHLSNSERKTVTSVTREALEEAGYTSTPIIAGVSQQSVTGTIECCIDAYNAGADAGLLLAPAYYRFAVTDELIKDYFRRVADASPIPIIIYNFPGVVAGLDLDSDLLIELAAHPNIIGTKFTCGNSGKLARVALATSAFSPLKALTPTPGQYFAISGIADFLGQALLLGGAGVISGAANMIPKTIVRVYNLFLQGKTEEAWAAQQQLSESDWVLTKIGLWGAKQGLQKYYGYGGYMRRPGKRLEGPEVEKLYKDIEAVMKFEESL